MRLLEASHILSSLPKERWAGTEGLTSDLPKPVHLRLHRIPLTVPAVDRQGWGAYLVPPNRGSPWKYPARPGTRSGTESCGDHVSDCWCQLSSGARPALGVGGAGPGPDRPVFSTNQKAGGLPQTKQNKGTGFNHLRHKALGSWASC